MYVCTIDEQEELLGGWKLQSLFENRRKLENVHLVWNQPFHLMMISIMMVVVMVVMVVVGDIDDEHDNFENDDYLLWLASWSSDPPKKLQVKKHSFAAHTHA